VGISRCANHQEEDLGGTEAATRVAIEEVGGRDLGIRGKPLLGRPFTIFWSLIMIMETVTVGEVLGRLRSECAGRGVSCHPFLLGWYHDMVTPPFHFPLDGDTLAVVVINTPSMFEELFIPFLRSPQYSPGTLDPIDQCFRHFFSQLRGLFPPGCVEVVHDFELLPSRKPRVLVQTAGHVAGVARYYQRKDVNPEPWPEERKIYGVSIHPEFGGWFAFRGILIFKDIKTPHLKRVEPEDCVPSQEMRVEVLERFNGNWQDGRWKDVVVGGPKERYSESQQLYFGTEPGQRLPLITKLCDRDQETG
jgi:methylmalonic aciduria homocystinuria type C protein